MTEAFKLKKKKNERKRNSTVTASLAGYNKFKIARLSLTLRLALSD